MKNILWTTSGGGIKTLEALALAIRQQDGRGLSERKNVWSLPEVNVTIFKSSPRRGALSAIRTGAMTLLLVTGILLAGCSGLKSSTAEVSQGSSDAVLDKPGSAESAILADLHGTVEIKTGDGQWTAAQPGQTLVSGQQLRSGALSNATLIFYDGSRMVLGAEAEIAVDVLDARTSGARLIQVTQVSGESQHEVVQSDDPGSHYDVNTPAGSGSAAGTQFTVSVLPGVLSQFWVEEGAVTVVNENVEVEVVAGQTTSVLVGQPPIEPELRITGEGQVMQIETVGDGNVVRTASTLDAQLNQNDKITLCHATGSATNPYVEITVSVAGATHGHANHPGDIIPAPTGGCPEFDACQPDYAHQLEYCRPDLSRWSQHSRFRQSAAR